MTTNDPKNTTNAADDSTLPLCITCSCCCAFHRPCLDEETGKIIMRCGNEELWGTDDPARER